MHFKGKPVTNVSLPGRGMGCADVPGLTVVGHANPADIIGQHGTIGDRWLLSALSAIAEFEGAIAALFAHTLDVYDMRDARNCPY